MNAPADSIDVIGPKGKFRIARSDAALYSANGYDPVDPQALAPASPPPGVTPGAGIPGMGMPAGAAVPRQQQLAGMDPWGFLKAAGQGVATTAATAALGPEAGLIPQMIAAYLASTGTHMGLTKLSGGEVTPGELTSGIPDALMIGAGHSLGGTLRSIGGRGLDEAYNVPRSAAESARDIASSQASRIAGKPTSVPYHEADIAAQLEKMGIVPGPSPTSGPLAKVAPETGSLAMGRAASAPMEERALLLKGFDNSGITATRQTFSVSSYITEAREGIRRTAGTKGVETFNKMLKDYIDGGTALSHGNVKGNVARGAGNPMRRMLPSEWESDKELWAKSAKYGSDPEVQAIKGRLARALTDGMRDHIESLTPVYDAAGARIPGAVGRIEQLNREYQRTLPLSETVNAAELPRSGPPGFSLKNPLGGMPYNEAGRAGMLLRGPGVQNTARYSPEAAMTIARLIALTHAPRQQ